ncbi:MAG: hypothetical protein CSYNP_04161 [Syntrophus sp. SKADARSKE-3]|nr:hypothetical protein [Syntrophus sp. SKADARSKE-3]
MKNKPMSDQQAALFPEEPFDPPKSVDEWQPLQIYKKCPSCKREYTKTELDQIQANLKASKETLKNKCPDCQTPLKTFDAERSHKKWIGFLNQDKSLIDHMVLVEFILFSDASYEARIPLLNHTVETLDFLEAIQTSDHMIAVHLENQQNEKYDAERSFLTQAYRFESRP